MEVTKREMALTLHPNSPVMVKDMGNVVEIVHNARPGNGPCIQKLDKDYYVDLRDGEVREFNHAADRSESSRQFKNTMRKLRDIINANVTDVSRCRWCTFTYAENMTDGDRLQKDWEHCWKKIKRRWEATGYISIAEPQGRGAWHLHVILLFDRKAPFVPNHELAAAWGQGFVTVKKLDSVDNVGAYLTAYLADLPVDEAKKLGISGEVKEIEVLDDDGKPVKKRFIKGARVHMYPTGFNFYRCSRGVRKPDKQPMAYGEALELVKGAACTYRATIDLEAEGGNYQNTITYESYNRKRRAACNSEPMQRSY